MSRQLLRRLLAIIAAYVLALQPIARVTVVHAVDGGTQLCSRAADETAPPLEREHDHACWLGTCCSGLAGPASVPVLVLKPKPALQRFPPVAAEIFVLPKARYPQSRAPPGWPA